MYGKHTAGQIARVATTHHHIEGSAPATAAGPFSFWGITRPASPQLSKSPGGHMATDFRYETSQIHMRQELVQLTTFVLAALEKARAET